MSYGALPSEADASAEAEAPRGMQRSLKLGGIALLGTAAVFSAGALASASLGGGADGESASAASGWLQAAAVGRGAGSARGGAAASASAYSIALSHESERLHGEPVGEGYPFASQLAEIHTVTRLEARAPSRTGLSADVPDALMRWSIEGLEGDAPRGASVEHTFTRVGAHAVSLAIGDEPDGVGRLAATTVLVKYVRRSLYKMTDASRNKFLEALHTMYTTDGMTGRQSYGESYYSIGEMVALHLAGAADKECDHWHDDAGFVTHHIAFTLMLEKSLQAVDSSVSVPYWDYTVDAYELDDWTESTMWTDSWFGLASPATDAHVVSTGRWAFTPVMGREETAAVSTIRNPYGLLRSPWNTNPTPYITRYRYVLGLKDGGYSLPTCDAFSMGFTQPSIAMLNDQLNGMLHGEAHIMLGGHWDYNRPNLTMSTGNNGVLLTSKFLWRQGVVRCPSYCALDSPSSECQCSCPAAAKAAVLGGADAAAKHAGDANSLAHAVLEATGVFTLSPVFSTEWLHRSGLSGWDDLLSLLCHVGHPGEMFTSAAPYDPSFWPLHGLADRFLALKRLQKHYNATDFDETWGYDHRLATVASDTHVVCDWAGVDEDALDAADAGSAVKMPTCAKGACIGHGADDVLPFGLGDKGKTYFTNQEFYDYMSPTNSELPYVYDSLTSWPACASQGISFYTPPSDDDDSA